MDSQTTVEDEADMELVDANIRDLWEGGTSTWENVAKQINEAWDLTLNGNSTRLRYGRYMDKLNSERRRQRKRQHKGVSTKSVDEVSLLQTQSVQKRRKTNKKSDKTSKVGSITSSEHQLQLSDLIRSQAAAIEKMRRVINGFTNASTDFLDHMTAANAAIEFFLTERLDDGLNVEERVPAEDPSALEGARSEQEVTYCTPITLA
jgi:hypothetical protein